MALRWIEGFDVNTHSSGDAFVARYESVTRPSALAFVAGRREAKGYSAAVDPLTVSTPEFTDAATWVVGLAIAGQGPESGNYLIELQRADTHQIGVLLSSDSDSNLVLAVKRGSTTLASYTLPKGPDYNYLEFKALVHTSAGTYELRVNEITVLSATGVNTADTGSNDADRVRLHFEVASALDYLYIDDLYILDGTGTDNTDFLGDSIVEEVLAVENGATIEWDAWVSGALNYTQVDDEGKDDGALTHVTPSNINLTDLYRFSGLDVLQEIHGVQMEIVAAVSASASNVKAVAFVGSTTDAGANLSVSSVSPSFKSVHHVWDLSPDSAAAWTPSEFSAAKFGIRSAA